MPKSRKQHNYAEATFDYAKAERGLRGPQHRWESATQLSVWPWDPVMEMYDEHVRAAHHVLELIAHSPTGAQQAQRQYPSVCAAMRLNEDPTMVGKLKIAVFGGIEPAEMVRRLGVDGEVLATWEKLFYDARNTRAALG